MTLSKMARGLKYQKDTLDELILNSLVLQNKNRHYKTVIFTDFWPGNILKPKIIFEDKGNLIEVHVLLELYL